MLKRKAIDKMVPMSYSLEATRLPGNKNILLWGECEQLKKIRMNILRPETVFQVLLEY